MLLGKPVLNVWVGVALTFAMLLFLPWLGDYGFAFVLTVRANGLRIDIVRLLVQLAGLAVVVAAALVTERKAQG